MNAVYDITTGIIPLRLDDEVDALLHSDSLKKNGRSARLLLEHGGELRLLMVALAPGASMLEHSVDGPALVQAIRGDLILRAGPDAWALQPGELLSIAAGLDHSVETVGGCVILVVVQGSGELHL